MKKIYCGCGCKSFQKIFEVTVTFAEFIFAYKCNQCGNEYTKSEVENFIKTSTQKDRVVVYREFD